MNEKTKKLVRTKIFNAVRELPKTIKNKVLRQHKEAIIDGFNNGLSILRLTEILNLTLEGEKTENGEPIVITRNELSYFLEYECGILTKRKKTVRKKAKKARQAAKADSPEHKPQPLSQPAPARKKSRFKTKKSSSKFRIAGDDL